MSEYLYGCDVLGADDGSFAQAVRASACADRPISADRACALLDFAFQALTAMDRVDLEPETAAWRDDMGRQLGSMRELIDNSSATMLPDKAADILCDAVEAIAEMMEEGAEFYPQLELDKDRLLQSIGVGIQVLGSRSTLGPRGQVLGSTGIFEIDSPAEEDVEEVLSGLYTVLGMFDIGAAQLKMNTLKPVTVGAAKALIHGGQQVISVAQEMSRASDLPDTNTLATTAGHLHWHQQKLAGLKDDKAIYDSADDAKKWTMQAFIESNAVEEGAAYLDEAWSQMWTEIGQNLASVPSKVISYAGGVVSTAVKSVTGLPMWAWSLVIIGGVGLVGYGAYKILSSSGGQNVLGAYFGARR